MKQTAVPPASATPPPGGAFGPVRGWEYVFLLAFSVAVLAACWLQTQREFLGHDELITAIFCANPNFGELLRTISQGGETNPPLYFILEWLVARGFGTGDFAMRALSAVSVGLAGWVIFFTVRPVTGPRAAALAVGLVLGLSRDAFLYLNWARYYGLFVLLAALAALLFRRFDSDGPVRTRDYGFVFATHCALVYLHLFGLFFSGMTLAAHLAADAWRGRMQWRLYGCFAAAWASFGLWVPSLLQQLQVTRGGTFTPRLDFGSFLEELGMQTPLALALVMVAGLGALAALATPPLRASEEAESGAASGGRAALLLLALAWMAVPVGAWAASNLMRPFYMRRYVAPSLIAWVLILAVVLAGVYLLARRGSPGRWMLPRWAHDAAWAGVLGFCLIFQPLRAAMNPPRPATAFTDQDFGHAQLPMVFEDSMDFLPRVVYGRGRSYALLIDRDAAEADTGYFTKLMERYFKCWRPYYQHIGICYLDELPAGPDGFLAVDAELAKTFDWLFEHRRDLHAQLVGQWETGQRVFLVKRVAP